MRWLWRWWRWFHFTSPRIARVSYYTSRVDVPALLPHDTLAVVGTTEHPKWAILNCPCGRGHQLTVSLSHQRRPYWRLSIDRQGPTLCPSIDFRSSYRCHFWLANGQVHWVRGWVWRARTDSD